MANLLHVPYSLELKQPFGTAHGTRTHTDGLLVAIESEGLVGYGEAFIPPYYPETRETMAAFFDLTDINVLVRLNESEDQNSYLDSILPENNGAKAAIDIALNDLRGKQLGLSVREMYFEKGQREWDRGQGANKEAGGVEPEHGTRDTEHGDPQRIPTSFTIGIDNIETMVAKAREATDFETLKIKLNGENDIAVIEAIRSVTSQNLFVDANQGWKDVEQAVTTAERLVELGVGLIEQPFPVGQHKKAGSLKASCGVPIVADEEVQSLEDIDRLADYYDGVNIKLMKAGGIYRAVEMIYTARDKGLAVLLGCMTESSIGISAAAQIAHLADWCDLDGNLLIKNDTCTGARTREGELLVSDEPGIGITDDTRLRELFNITG